MCIHASAQAIKGMPIQKRIILAFDRAYSNSQSEAHQAKNKVDSARMFMRATMHTQSADIATARAKLAWAERSLRGRPARSDAALAAQKNAPAQIAPLR